MAENDRAQHLIFAQQFSFGFNHQYCAFGTGDNQIQLTVFQLIGSRVKHVLVINITHARCADWAIEWDTRQAQRGGRANHRNDIRMNLRVHRNHRCNNLNFVHEAFREQRTNRAVNQTRNQGFAFARTAFTTEEAARDTTSSVGTLLIVNGQREEVLTWFSFFLTYNGHEYSSVIHAYHHSGGSLARHHTGL